MGTVNPFDRLFTSASMDHLKHNRLLQHVRRNLIDPLWILVGANLGPAFNPAKITLNTIKIRVWIVLLSTSTEGNQALPPLFANVDFVIKSVFILAFVH